MATKDTREPKDRRETKISSNVTPDIAPEAALPANKAADELPDASRSSGQEVADFLAKMQALPRPAGLGRGRLIFAMDATMSRQPTWDMAMQLQSEMFAAVEKIGGLDVQLVYFRGFGECRASKWVGNPMALQRLMTQVGCQGGRTQIGKVLTHARRESEAKRVNALVYVGDSMEESVDELCARAGELGLLGVPVFLFQEGYDPLAERAFKEIGRLTGGAWCRFDAGSAAQLRELLAAVAVYATGGREALLKLGTGRTGGGARALLQQMKPSAS